LLLHRPSLALVTAKSGHLSRRKDRGRRDN
jgi:hypothetical protein